jgi:transcriptional regulator with XRE-family HTH domain
LRSNEQAFGAELRTWRSQRGLSQLDLALVAGVSARHVSFLETSQASPSREMVLRLADALDLPLRVRNSLLVSAGFAPRFGTRPLEDGEMEAVRRALRFHLEAHEPYPAFVLDRYWRIVDWNKSQAALLSDLADEDGSLAHLNALDLVFEPGLMRERFENWERVALTVLRRLRRQISRAGSDDRDFQRIWNRVCAAPGVDALLHAVPAAPPSILVPMHIRQDDQTLTWFSTLTVFGAVEDATLEELVIESFFPGNEATRLFVEEALAQAGVRS